MDYIRLREMQIDGRELSRNQDELEQFIAKYSKNHVELKFMINGYQLISENQEELILQSIFVTKVFPFKEGRKFEVAWKKIEIFEALLAYIFQTPKNHSIRFSAGNGTIFPKTRNYGLDIYASNIMMGKNDVDKDWKSKQETLHKYLDFFFEHEIDALPILWYGKGLIANDNTSAFLHFYRCIEILSKIHIEKINSEMREIIENALKVETKKSKIQKIYASVGIPNRMMIPLYLEEHGIQEQTYEKWRKFRNKMTHGELTLELNDDFRHEMSNLQNTAKDTLDTYVIEHFK